MRWEFNGTGGRIGVAAAIVMTLVLTLAVLALYFYSERAAPPETEVEAPSRIDSGDGRVRSDPPAAATPSDPAAGTGFDETTGIDDGGPTNEGAGLQSGGALESAAAPEPEPKIALERQQQLLREDLAVRLGPGQLEMVVDERLIQRLVTTVNSLDGAPVPLRFRPLAHVPDLPRLDRDGDESRLPESPDPRYLPYRAMFDRLDAVEMAELFDRYEPALEKAWQALGEHPGQTFRQRAVEVLEHLSEFELPASRPAVHQPRVLYEYIDPSLEQLSWGRKILVRIGPAHAPAVQRQLAALAERLARPTR